MDNGLTARGIAATAIISRVFHGPVSIDTSGVASYTLYATVAFTTASGPAHARVTLENCSGVCRAYRDGGHLTITYDSQNPASAVTGYPSAPALHLNTAVVSVGAIGLVLLVAAAVNLLAGV